MKNIKQLGKKLEKLQKDCMDNAYDPKKNDWNPKHFKYCEGDLIAAKIDCAEDIYKMVKKIWAKEYSGDRDNKEFYAIDDFKNIILSKIEGK